MNEQLSLAQLNTLYSTMQPVFHMVLKSSMYTPTISKIVEGDDRQKIRQERQQQDEVDKQKIRGALSW